jgi:signal transduction histidine kinase
MRPHRLDAFGALQLRAYSRAHEQYQRRLNAVLEQQARSIGQALHDEAGQLLTAACIALAEASRDLPEPVGQRLLAVKRHLAGVEEQLRQLAHELQPPLLEERGLVRAIEYLARGFSARHGIETHVQVDARLRLPLPIATVLYRMVQEGLTNIARHAGATRACIRITETAVHVRCTVRDDGSGFDLAAAMRRRGGALGLHGIRERVKALNGVLAIRSVRGVGTDLTATIPLHSAER